MATYFLSDPHGEYDLFMRLLDGIAFSGGDVLYVCGDLIDKGTNASALVRFARKTPNVRVLCGNHEYEFIARYHALMRALCDEDDPEEVLRELQSSSAFRTLTWEDVDYLESLPYYIEESDFVCVHAGAPLSSSGEILPLSTASEKLLVFDRNFKSPSVVPKNSKTVLFGHTPCCYDNADGRFIKTPKEGRFAPRVLSDYAKIRLDTGVALTGMLGLLRKEDMREFYVTGN